MARGQAISRVLLRHSCTLIRVTTCSSDLEIAAVDQLQTVAMSGLAAAISVLNVLSETLEAVPVVGTQLKAAAKLCSTICEKVKVREDGL
jgi:hypothetical protein